MRIAITGAAGWLGRYVTTALEPDHELVLVDNVALEDATIFDPTSPGGRRHVPLSPTSPYHRTDILDEPRLRRAFADVEVVIHLAGRPTGEWENAKATVYDVSSTRRVSTRSGRSSGGSVVDHHSVGVYRSPRTNRSLQKIRTA
jgi:UDP-glucose 4-epimerase